MRVLVAPDSFKGSLSATQVCEIIKSALQWCEVDCIPVADGGEGTVDRFVKGMWEISPEKQEKPDS